MTTPFVAVFIKAASKSPSLFAHGRGLRRTTRTVCPRGGMSQLQDLQEGHT